MHDAKPPLRLVTSPSIPKGGGALLFSEHARNPSAESAWPAGFGTGRKSPFLCRQRVGCLRESRWKPAGLVEGLDVRLCCLPATAPWKA